MPQNATPDQRKRERAVAADANTRKYDTLKLKQFAVLNVGGTERVAAITGADDDSTVRIVPLVAHDDSSYGSAVVAAAMQARVQLASTPHVARTALMYYAGAEQTVLRASVRFVRHAFVVDERMNMVDSTTAANVVDTDGSAHAQAAGHDQVCRPGAGSPPSSCCRALCHAWRSRPGQARRARR